MPDTSATTFSRRQLLKAGGLTFAGYAMVPDPALALAITTDTQGITAGDMNVRMGDYDLPVYEARPASGTGHPVLLVISEVWGLHEYIRDCTRRFAKEGFHAVVPELFKREGGVAHMTDIPAILRIVLAQKREQTLGDCKAAVDWAKGRPGARADRVGVTGWCWGGSTTIQVAATNPDIKAAVAWYGSPGRAYHGASGPVTGFDVAKDIHVPFLGLVGEMDSSASPADVVKFGEMVKPHDPNVEIVIFPGVGHGFHADYRQSYDAGAAQRAWKLCVDFLDTYLKG